MKDDNFNKKLSQMKYSRIIAWVCIVIIAFTIIATLITGITGSDYFYGCLFMCIIVPFLMYVALWIGRLLFSVNNDGTNKEDEKENNSTHQDNSDLE